MENSCEFSLHNRLREDLLGCATWKNSGPYFYYLMIKRIISSTKAAVTVMTDRIKNMKLTAFPGEINHYSNRSTENGDFKVGHN